MKEEKCKDISKCEKAKQYKAEGKAYCLICSIPLNKDNSEKNASDRGFFKHASEDL